MYIITDCFINLKKTKREQQQNDTAIRKFVFIKLKIDINVCNFPYTCKS